MGKHRKDFKANPWRDPYKPLGSRRGVGDKPMSFKPEVAGSIPGFSIKPLSVSLRLLPSYPLRKKMHCREQFSRTIFANSLPILCDYSAMFTFHMQIRSTGNTLS